MIEYVQGIEYVHKRVDMYKETKYVHRRVGTYTVMEAHDQFDFEFERFLRKKHSSVCIFKDLIESIMENRCVSQLKHF